MVQKLPHKDNWAQKTRHFIFGHPKDLNDPHIFHKLALIPALAWVGLGADGLSSSAYGPEEAFHVILNHRFLAIFLGLATIMTVFIISYCYSKIIEYFPSGGGGYLVATKTLGPVPGVISGSALVIDYILTITVSIAACGQAIFSFVPAEYHYLKIAFCLMLIVFLMVLNMRGLKESIAVLTPIFVVFVISHIILLFLALKNQVPQFLTSGNKLTSDFKHSVDSLGYLGLLGLFLRSYTMGAGTYTGIEAVSNGLQIMKEPRVQTGKRTMLYMSLSLAFTASALFICYYFSGINPTPGKTLNAVLAESVFGQTAPWMTYVIIFSEGMLLLVAAQAGFIDGPRVMANMALDYWLPKKYALLSEQMTMKNGIMIMGVVALIILYLTKGNLSYLVVMYSINVFVTFSLSMYGMSSYMIKRIKKNVDPKMTWYLWKNLFVFIVGFIMCFGILSVTVFEKFKDGGWITIIVTTAFVGMCFVFKNQYNKTRLAINRLEITLLDVDGHHTSVESMNQNYHMTAIQLVTGYNSFGVNTFQQVIKSFPGFYKKFVFLNIGLIDSAVFRSKEELEAYNKKNQQDLDRYVEMAKKFGVQARSVYEIGADFKTLAMDAIVHLKREYPKSTVFAGELSIENENFFSRLLHNNSSYILYKSLQEEGITMVILPLKVRI
jgi:amino acid transporter